MFELFGGCIKCIGIMMGRGNILNYFLDFVILLDENRGVV